MPMPRFNDDKEEQKPDAPADVFDNLQITLDGHSISIVTDPIAKESKLQDQFEKLIEKRFIKENWDFILEVQALLSSKQGTPDFVQKTKQLGNTYFKKGADNQLNLSSQDLDALYAITQQSNRSTLSLSELTVSHSERTRQVVNVVTEMFILGIKNNLKKEDLATLDLKPYLESRQRTCLLIAACDTVAVLRSAIAKLREYPLPQKRSLLGMSALEKAGLEVGTWIEAMDKFRHDLVKLLCNADSMTLPKLEEKFEKYQARYLKGSSGDIGKYAKRIGNNLDDVMKTFNQLHQEVIATVNPQQVGIEKIKAVSGALDGLQSYIENTVDGIAMVNSPLSSKESQPMRPQSPMTPFSPTSPTTPRTPK